jgi:hypothetical protein
MASKASEAMVRASNEILAEDDPPKCKCWERDSETFLYECIAIQVPGKKDGDAGHRCWLQPL